MISKRIVEDVEMFSLEEDWKELLDLMRWTMQNLSVVKFQPRRYSLEARSLRAPPRGIQWLGARQFEFPPPPSVWTLRSRSSHANRYWSLAEG